MQKVQTSAYIERKPHNASVVGIISAMKKEIDTLLSMIKNPKQIQVGGVIMTHGMLCNQQVVLCVCGIGKVFAAMACEAMILHFSPTMILNIGVGGSLDPALRVCDVALAQDMVQHDIDTTPLGDPAGWISGLNKIRIPCAKPVVQALERAVCALRIPYRCGTIASGDQFIGSEAQKTRIRQMFGAIACEMEGAAIVQVCYTNRIPVAVLRTISDGANDSSPVDYETFSRRAAEQAMQIVMQFLSSPLPFPNEQAN